MKLIVITGAGSGVGEATAKRLQLAGYRVILLGRTAQKLLTVTSGLAQPAPYYVVDVRDAAAVEQVVERIIEDHGPIDVWINNAGIGLFETVLNTPLDQFARIMDTNYYGVLHGVKAVLPHMLRRDQGHIINIGSMAGKLATAKSAAYAASKHAVLGFTNALRAELVDTGVIITAINPGPIDTVFMHQADRTGTYTQRVKNVLLTATEVAETIAKVIIKQPAEVDLPFVLKFGFKLYSLAPRLLDRLAGRWIHRK